MQNNFYTQNLNHEYPYGDFPYNFTKQGQEQLKEQIKRGDHLRQDTANILQTSPNKEEKVESIGNNHKNPTIQSIMPLLTTMSNPNANMNDMLKLLAPYLNQSGLPITDMIKLMNQMSQNQSNKVKQENSIPSSSTTCNIDFYERVR